MASCKIPRSNSGKLFCTIPSHMCNSLDYYCYTCSKKICVKCVDVHPGHDMSAEKRQGAECFDTNSSCRKNVSKINRLGRLQSYGSENSLSLYSKTDQAQCAVADDKETLKEDKKRRCDQEDGCNEDHLLKKRTIEELKMKHKTIQHMYFGYKVRNKNETLLVVILSSDDETVPDSCNGFQIYKRSESKTSKEAENVMYAVAQDKEYFISSSKRNQLKDAIAQNIEKLLNEHSNITIVSYCPIKSSRATGNHFKYQNKICIVIYCRIKGIIPAGEQPFPTEINGFPVDVREAYASFTAMHNDDLPKSNDQQIPLRIGAEIRISGQTGTLGFFVDLDNNQKGFITCAHVAVKKEHLRTDLSINNHDRQLYRVFQPSEDVHEIGYVEKAIFNCNDRFKTSTDAALVRITDPSRNPIDGFMVRSDEEILRFAGYSLITPPCFDSGMKNTDPSPGIRIMKCGASTGITVGMLCADGIYVRLENLDMHFPGDSQTKFTMCNQYDVYAMERHKLFRLGDSGAIVLEGLGPNLTIVGMAIGETSYGSAIVTPIKDILNGLGLTKNSVTSFRPKACIKKRKVSEQILDYDQNIISSAFPRFFPDVTHDQQKEMTSKDTKDEWQESVNEYIVDENIAMRLIEKISNNLKLSDDKKEQNKSDFSQCENESIQDSDEGASALPRSRIFSAESENVFNYESKGARPKHSKTNKVEKQNTTQLNNDSHAASKSHKSEKDAPCSIRTPSGMHLEVNASSIEMSGGEVKTIHVRNTE